jgi:archaellum component FlaF (FlaF/FlaG flagellin family)
MKRGIYIAVSLLLAVMLGGCASKKMHLDVPLEWTPTGNTSAGYTTAASSQQYKIAAFTDARQNKKEIAKNIEDKKVKIVTTRDNVADWCRDRFKVAMRQHGFKVVEDNASVIIKGEVLQFYVVEDSVYKANVRIKLTAENAEGKALWEGEMSGEASRFGHSYSMENYYEALSDAYLGAVDDFINNQVVKLEPKK